MTKKYCLIIPCYNEFNRIPIQSYIDFLNSDSEFDLLFVNDGSTDQTTLKLQELEQAGASVLELRFNRGKAAAVREAFLKFSENSGYKYIGYYDSDLATPLTELIGFKNVLADESYVCVFGSRLLRIGGNIKRLKSRHYIGRIFATFASILLDLPIYDTQCGAKFFHSSIVEICFKDKFVTNWTFDIEIFFRIKNELGRVNFLQKVYELPLGKWTDIAGSKVSFVDCLRLPRDFFRIYLKYKK